jgi:hypothetical protein
MVGMFSEQVRRLEEATLTKLNKELSIFDRRQKIVSPIA